MTRSWSYGFLVGGLLILLVVSLPGAQETAPIPPESGKAGVETAVPGSPEEPLLTGTEGTAPPPPQTVIPAPEEAPPLQGAEGTLPPGEIAEEAALPPTEGTAPAPAVVHVDFTVKKQWVSVKPDSNKAREYRILPEGLYVEELSFVRSREDQDLEGSLRHFLLLEDFRQGRFMEDSSGEIEWRKYGLIDLQAGFQKGPHLYASGLRSTTLGGITTLDAARERDHLNVRFTPGEQLTLRMDLSVEQRSGFRPFPTENATALGSDGKIAATAVVEVAEPIHYTTTTVLLGAEYLDGPLVVQLENKLQMFNNGLATSMTWDNPYRDIDGRAKLPEDHWTHTLTLQPSYKFSDRWHLMNSISYMQVVSTIHLVNFSSTSDVGEPVPFSEIEPDVRTLSIHSALTGRPWDNLLLKFRFRRNSYANDTAILTPFPAYVKLEEEVRYSLTPQYMTHRQQTVEMEADYRPWTWGHIEGGIHRVASSRNQLEISMLREMRYFINVFATLGEAFSASGGYRYIQGRNDGYNPQWFHTVYDPLSEQTQHPLLRAWNLADFTADELHANLTYRPSDTLSVGVSARYAARDYPDTQIGRKASGDQSASVDLQYAPWERVVTFAQFSRERSDIRGSYTWTFSNAPATPAQDPTYIEFRQPLSGTLTDRNDTFLVGLQYEPSPRTQWTGSYLRSHGTESGLTLPSTGNRYEEFSIETHHRFSEEVENFARNFSLGMEYRYEHYRRSDFSLQNFQGPGDVPNPASPQDLFLGIRDPGYRAHVFSLSCTFYF